MKTPITYYGGKQNLVPYLLEIIPEHTVYTESYAGGLALFFKKQKVQSEIINDNNAFIMNFYSVLTTDFEALKAKIEATPYSRVVYKVAQTMYKAPHLFDPIQRAWSFYVLCNMGFSSSFSFGCYTKGSRALTWEKKKLIVNHELRERLVGVQIEATDALRILTLRDSPETLHFVDPPYWNSLCSHYAGYTELDFKNLLETLEKLQGKFILSNYPSDLLSIYAKKNNWYQKEIVQPISVNRSKTGKNRQKIEVITTNYPI